MALVGWWCRNNPDALEKAIERAKLQLMAIVNQVQGFLDMNQLISAGPFLYAVPTEVTTWAKGADSVKCKAQQ